MLTIVLFIGENIVDGSIIDQPSILESTRNVNVNNCTYVRFCCPSFIDRTIVCTIVIRNVAVTDDDDSIVGVRLTQLKNKSAVT